MISSQKGSSSESDRVDRLLPSGTTITGVNWLEPSSVSKCVWARQVNCGTSADRIRGPTCSISVRLRVHDGLALNRRPSYSKCTYLTCPSDQMNLWVGDHQR